MLATRKRGTLWAPRDQRSNVASSDRERMLVDKIKGMDGSKACISARERTLSGFFAATIIV